MSKTHSTSRQIVTYSVGFISSIALTLAAYALATNGILQEGWSPTVLILALSLLAVIQLLVQLIFFLHIGNESKPRWQLMSFIFAFIVLGIIVFGSLWIMFDMNSRMMTSPTDMIKYMNRQSGV